MTTHLTWKEHLSLGRRAIHLLYSLSRRYFCALLLDRIVSALTPYVPIFFSARLIDALAAGAPRSTLALYAALAIGLTALFGVLHSYLSAQRNIGWSETFCTHEWRYAQKAMHLSYASIEDRDVALLCERIQAETHTGYNIFYLTSAMDRLISALVQVLASFSLTASFFAAGAIPLWAKAALIGGVLLTLLLRIPINAKAARHRLAYYADCTQHNIVLEKFFQYFSRYTSGMDIRLYGMEKPLVHYEGEIFDNLCNAEQTMRLHCARLNLISTLAQYALRFGVYLLLIAAALRGNLSVGSIAQYVACIMLLLTAVSEIVSSGQLALLNHTYLKRYFSYFDLPNPMYQGTLSVEKRTDEQYDVEFRDVSFRYPNTETYALRHVSLKFKAGEKLAVVGMNGSGKTTMIKLLCRLYDPTEGVILLNGVDIRKYDYDEYLSLFSVVFQDFRLFSFSLGQNVAASADYDAARVTRCLQEAGFGKRLAELPNGLATGLYQDFDRNGIEISGGEAQKIALARALYPHAPFIVLDEPTAALDPVSEYETYRKFSEMAAGKTAVYISHRLASCRFCDEILVFDGGRIVQHGTHDALLAEKDGVYASLWHAQAQYYTE